MNRTDYRREEAQRFSARMKALGFRVYMAERGTYGFVTDDEGSRVLSFGFSTGGDLGGNYGPPSQESGTGWAMDAVPQDLVTAEDVRKALYAHPPVWCGRGWKSLTTAEQHLKTYGASSRYAEAD